MGLSIAIGGMGHAGGLALRGMIGRPVSGIAPGTLTVLGHTSSTVSLSATEATGGTGPYAHQFSHSLVSSSGPWTNWGSNYLAQTDMGLSAATVYWERMTWVDSLGNSVSQIVQVATDVAPAIPVNGPIAIDQSVYMGNQAGSSIANIRMHEQWPIIFMLGTLVSETVQILAGGTYTVYDQFGVPVSGLDGVALPHYDTAAAYNVSAYFNLLPFNVGLTPGWYSVEANIPCVGSDGIARTAEPVLRVIVHNDFDPE